MRDKGEAIEVVGVGPARDHTTEKAEAANSTKAPDDDDGGEFDGGITEYKSLANARLCSSPSTISQSPQGWTGALGVRLEGRKGMPQAGERRVPSRQSILRVTP